MGYIVLVLDLSHYKVRGNCLSICVSVLHSQTRKSSIQSG